MPLQVHLPQLEMPPLPFPWVGNPATWCCRLPRLLRNTLRVAFSARTAQPPLWTLPTPPPEKLGWTVTSEPAKWLLQVRIKMRTETFTSGVEGPMDTSAARQQVRVF